VPQNASSEIVRRLHINDTISHEPCEDRLCSMCEADKHCHGQLFVLKQFDQYYGQVRVARQRASVLGPEQERRAHLQQGRAGIDVGVGAGSPNQKTSY